MFGSFHHSSNLAAGFFCETAAFLQDQKTNGFVNLPPPNVPASEIRV